MRSPSRCTLRGARVQVFGSLEATLHPREKWDADYFLKNTLKAEVAYSMVAQIQRQIMWFDNTKVVIEGVTIGVMELLEWASELSVGQAGFGAQIRFYGRNFKRYFTPSSSPSRRRGWSSLHQYMVSMIPDFCIGLPQFICDGESESRQLRQWLETWSTSASVDVTLCDGRDNTRDSPPGGCRDSQYSQAYIGKDHMDKTNREPIGRDRHMTLVQSMQCMGSCPTGSQGTQTPQHQQRVPWLRGLQEYPRTHIGQCKRGTQGYFACREVDQAAKCHLPPATTVSAVQQRYTTYTRSPLPTPVAEYRPLQQQPPQQPQGGLITPAQHPLLPPTLVQGSNNTRVVCSSRSSRCSIDGEVLLRHLDMHGEQVQCMLIRMFRVKGVGHNGMAESLPPQLMRECRMPSYHRFAFYPLSSGSNFI